MPKKVADQHMYTHRGAIRYPRERERERERRFYKLQEVMNAMSNSISNTNVSRIVPYYCLTYITTLSPCVKLKGLPGCNTAFR